MLSSWLTIRVKPEDGNVAEDASADDDDDDGNDSDDGDDKDGGGKSVDWTIGVVEHGLGEA